MKENNPVEANEIFRDLQPIEQNESILKASVSLSLGQINGELSQIEQANTIYADIGTTETVKDTVWGRQCLASSKFIVGDYEETLRVLQTIEEIVGDIDEFNYDKAMTLASLSKWAEAERYLLLVKNQSYTHELFYLTWLCRCYIKNKKPEAAWNLYIDSNSTDDSKALLRIIGSDCFLAGSYYYAMRAYDVLAKYEPDQNYKDGMVSSAVGVFRGVLTKKESNDKLSEVMNLLAQEPEAQQILQAIQQYAFESGELDAPY
jgi:intraflagellar transport protein 56